MGSAGPWELAIVGVIVVLMFGTKRLPELGSGLGKAISNFKRSYKDGSALDVTPQKEKAPEAKPEEDQSASEKKADS
jgi:sec-independent protein translocase protein TatA